MTERDESIDPELEEWYDDQLTIAADWLHKESLEAVATQVTDSVIEQVGDYLADGAHDSIYNAVFEALADVIRESER